MNLYQLFDYTLKLLENFDKICNVLNCEVQVQFKLTCEFFEFTQCLNERSPETNNKVYHLFLVSILYIHSNDSQRKKFFMENAWYATFITRRMIRMHHVNIACHRQYIIFIRFHWSGYFGESRSRKRITDRVTRLNTNWTF